MHMAYVAPQVSRHDAAAYAFLLAAPPAIAAVAILAPGALFELVVNVREAGVKKR